MYTTVSRYHLRSRDLPRSYNVIDLVYINDLGHRTEDSHGYKVLTLILMADLAAVWTAPGSLTVMLGLFNVRCESSISKETEIIR